MFPFIYYPRLSRKWQWKHHLQQREWLLCPSVYRKKKNTNRRNELWGMKPLECAWCEHIDSFSFVQQCRGEAWSMIRGTITQGLNPPGVSKHSYYCYLPSHSPAFSFYPPARDSTSWCPPLLLLCPPPIPPAYKLSSFLSLWIAQSMTLCYKA